jgi:hypothetical protein
VGTSQPEDDITDEGRHTGRHPIQSLGLVIRARFATILAEGSRCAGAEAKAHGRADAGHGRRN